jgi:thioredoxin 2
MADSKVVACGRCAQKNRVRSAATAVPHCGKCGAALPWLAEATTRDFAAVVERSPLPVLADFWAPWCGPCRMIAPAIEGLAADLAGKLKVAKVNTDENQELGARYAVRGIPTLILFQDGRERDRVTGALPPPALAQWVEARVNQAGVR